VTDLHAVARNATRPCVPRVAGSLVIAELYVAILKLYDALNRKLPCRLRIPKTNEVLDQMKK
jgi:hypothetical protein